LANRKRRQMASTFPTLRISPLAENIGRLMGRGIQTTGLKLKVWAYGFLFPSAPICLVKILDARLKDSRLVCFFKSKSPNSFLVQILMKNEANFHISHIQYSVFHSVFRPISYSIFSI
jgi:hypothetical protein